MKFYTVCFCTLVVFIDGVDAESGSWNKTHYCCDGTVSEMNFNKEPIHCCGSRYYDPEIHLCCGTTVAEIATGNATSFGCCELADTNDRILFDQTRFTCCKTKIVANELPNQYYSCCGDDPYHYEDFLCCGDKLTPRKPNHECCGERLMYDTQSQLCTNEFHSDKNDWTFKIMNISNNHTEICKDKLFDTETEACCSSSVVTKNESLKHYRYPGCCQSSSGVTTYNYSSHICCSTGELLEIPPYLGTNPYAECCAGQLLTNYTWQQCCDDKIIERPGKNQGYCCGSELLSDYRNQFCCGEVIHRQPDGGNLDCCDQSTQLCCDGIQKPADLKFARCCYSSNGTAIYDARTEFCHTNGVAQLDAKEIARRTEFDPLCSLP